jgi:thymidylate synthase, flavin-dependent
VSVVRTDSDVDVRMIIGETTATDMAVVNAARVSTLGETTVNAELSPERVKGLINFLMRDRHGTPFEHTPMTFFVKAPIFVAREFMRHRVGWSYNEESGRYKELQPDFYVPGPDRLLQQVGKAGRYQFEPGTERQRMLVANSLPQVYEYAYHAYQEMLDDGVAREVARMVLPVGMFTSFYATCNARSLMHFLGLRTIHEEAKIPSFPQREIAMVAEKMEELWAGVMPLTHAAFTANGRISP